MAHPNEPTLERLLEIRKELCDSNRTSHCSETFYQEKLLAINSQIRRKEKE